MKKTNQTDDDKTNKTIEINETNENCNDTQKCQNSQNVQNTQDDNNQNDFQNCQNECEYRAEIICNQSIQDDVIELLEQEISDIQYTFIENVNGKGLSSKKLGNTTWPEMNFLLFVYSDLAGAKKIKTIVETLKKKFPQEGISVFFSKCEVLP